MCVGVGVQQHLQPSLIFVNIQIRQLHFDKERWTGIERQDERIWQGERMTYRERESDTK
jgi:hypothetical protein